jgi:hypothetical protein
VGEEGETCAHVGDKRRYAHGFKELKGISGMKSEK